MRAFIAILVIIALAAVAFFGLTHPQTAKPATYDGLSGVIASGEQVFHAAGCASCHTEPDAAAADAPILAGGQAFTSDFGTFYAPNISSDPEFGIGAWTVLDLANALAHGVSPEGSHYYPAFPYTSYAKMTPQDIVDLRAYMETLPASSTPSRAHDVGFPFNMRSLLGGWKHLYASDDWVVTATPTAELERGRYLVEALGHCGECHTPRDGFGGLKRSEWLTGATLPGEGRIPGITPAQLDWLAEDIAYYLETGFTPDFDSAGRGMAHVIENMSKLPASDREAIAAYLVALP